MNFGLSNQFHTDAQVGLNFKQHNSLHKIRVSAWFVFAALFMLNKIYPSEIDECTKALHILVFIYLSIHLITSQLYSSPRTSYMCLVSCSLVS